MPPRTFVALVGAGFRRWATYRQATIAGGFTNCVFGFLRCYVLLAVVGSSAHVVGYDRDQIVTYVWLGQGVLGVVTLWGWSDLNDRVKSGDITIDLLRPVNPIATYFATDLGRACHAALTRLIAPLVVGAIAFGLYVPRRPQTFALAVMSLALAVGVSFAVRYLVNLTAFWVLDARGFLIAWAILGNVATGLVVPVRFFPDIVQWVLWCTPFPYMFQAPIDIAIERVGPLEQWGLIGVQAVVLVALLWTCDRVQRRGVRTLVIQGG